MKQKIKIWYLQILSSGSSDFKFPGTIGAGSHNLVWGQQC
jgi:hypothetical protein